MKPLSPWILAVGLLCAACEQSSVSVEGGVDAALATNETVVRRDVAPFVVKPGEKVDVETSFGAIEVTTKEGAGAEYVAEVSASGRTKEEAEAALDRYRVEAIREGEIVRIRLVGSPLEIRTAAGVRRVAAVASFVVTAPHKVSVYARSGSGRIVVRGNAAGADAATQFGDVEISGAYGMVRGKSGSGAVTVRDVSAGHVEVDSSFGDVAIRNGRGTSKAKTGSGKVVYENWNGSLVASSSFGDVSAEGALTFVDLSTGSGSARVVARPKSVAAKEWSIRSNFGDVTLEASDAFDVDVTASTGFGKVRSDFAGPEAEEKTDPKRWTGRIGRGGHEVKLSSGSGDVHIRRLDS